MYKPKITKEELFDLPLGSFGGEIVVVESYEALEQACCELQKCNVIGFDTETRPSFQKGTRHKMALVQLATHDKAFLIRMNKLKLTPDVAAIFENSDILKVGASIRDDIKGIQKQLEFTPQGFVDIQSIVPEYGICDFSVRKVSAIVLGIRISKAQRLSNWEANVLTPSQQIYAATDAWSCLEIYLKLKQ